MRYVVDEGSWNLDGIEPAQCIEVIEQILDRIDDAWSLGYECYYSDDLFNIPVRDGMSFYELYGNESPLIIPADVRIRVAASFNQLKAWQDLESPWPADLEVKIDGEPLEYAPSVAWAHAQVILGAGIVGCISHYLRRQIGYIPVVVAGIESSIWFVCTDRETEHIFRWLILNETNNPDEMEALSAAAFKNLTFVQGCFNGIKGMSKPYKLMAPAIVRHLAALSDEGKRVFNGPHDRVSAEFGPLHVDISDENGDTKSNGLARQERTKLVDGRDRIFWWHTKIERHQDRIHICPEDLANNGKILIGIFCLHLTV